MARHTHDREDLMREGTAMPVRGRLLINGNEVVVGFRPSGACSIYWDQDPVFQFDQRHRLRRAYVESCRYKILRRLRDALQQISRELQRSLESSLESQPSRSQPSGLDCVGLDREAFARRLLDWIAERTDPVEIAETPSP